MPLKTHLDEQPTLNLTPMIDIVFLLMIFFMVGTKFTELERSLELQVPEVSSAGTLTAAPQKKIINVHHDGRITLNRQVVSLGDLTDQLASARSQYQNLGVIVRGDATGAFQNVAAVLSACRQAGISDLGISVRMADQRR